jgi:threonine/homoserine/homoserine lactone efflux protein
MSLSDWFSLALICILGATSPGPSLAVIIASTRTNGRRGGLYASLGHGLGIFIYALVAATSLSYIITNHKPAFDLLQLAGAFLLLWLGGRLFLAGMRARPTDTGEVAPPRPGSSFTSGFAIAILNPKIAAFFAVLFSQFVASGQGTVFHIAMAMMAGLIDVAAYVLIVFALSGQRLRHVLDRHNNILDLLLGTLLLLLGLSLIASRLLD